MDSGPPLDHTTEFGHPAAPQTLAGTRLSTTRDNLYPFSALQPSLVSSQPLYGHPQPAAMPTALGPSAPAFNTTLRSFPQTASYPGPTQRPVGSSSVSPIGNSTAASPQAIVQAGGYIPTNVGYYHNPSGIRPQLGPQPPLTSVPATSNVSLGHPATSMAPAMDPMSFFGASPSSSGLRLLPLETLDAASRQSNWARKMSASRSNGKGKGKARGAANPTPTLGNIPVVSAAMVSCPVVIEFYPWVNSPGEKRKDIFIYTERQVEFRSRQATFGAFYFFPTIDSSCPITALLDWVLQKMTSEPFCYRFEDLGEITGRDGASIWERLPFFILVPTNKGTPRPTTGAIHLDVLPEFQPLTLGGLTEVKKIKDAANHTIWEQRPGEGKTFILRIASKVRFTARSATAFTTSVQSTVHQHTCIKDRMEFCLTTNNVQEGLPTYRKAQGTDYLFDAGELSSDDESVARALRARQGEPSFALLESDEERVGNSIPPGPSTLLSGRGRPEPFPMHVELPPTEDDADLPDLPGPGTAGSSNLRDHTRVNTNDTSSVVSSSTSSVVSGQSVSPTLIPPTTPRHTSINSAASEAEDHSLMDMEIDFPSPDARSVSGDAPPANTSTDADGQRLFEAAPPSLRELFPQLERTHDLYAFSTLIPTAAANPHFPNRSPDRLLPAQEKGIDIRAPTIEGLAALLEETIREAITSKDFTKVLAKRSFFAITSPLNNHTIAIGQGPRNEALSHLIKLHLSEESGYFVPTSGGYHTVAPGPSAYQASLLTAQHGSELEFLGSIHGLSLAWLGRAPLGFSPFHLLYLMYAGRLAAMTPVFLEAFDPDTFALVKSFRSSQLQELTQEPWKSRLLHHFEVSPVFLTRFPKDTTQAEAWKNELELAFVIALTLGATVSGLEFQVFNNGLKLPCRNGFDLVAAISTYRAGTEAFIRDTWGGVIQSYDSIADKLKFRLSIGNTTMEWMRNQLQQLDPGYKRESWMNFRDAIIGQLQGYFKRALSHPPSRFIKGLKRLMKEGLCSQFDETQLANPAFFVRQFHVAARGSALTLGQGLGAIMVTFEFNSSTDSCGLQGLEFSTCTGEVSVPISEILNFLAVDSYKPGTEISSGHDAIDWFIIQSILTQVAEYGKL